MPTHETVAAGTPCWADLWTSDVGGSRRFYGELLGWEPQEPSAEFHGYFMFHREGVPVAGGMGPMPDAPADNSWKCYLRTNDIEHTVKVAAEEGAEVVVPPMPVADLGIQAVLVDPTGAPVGAWQPGTFSGFAVVGEHGAPSWFELHTGDHARALDFYRAVFGWETTSVADTDEFRYTTACSPGTPGLIGVMDARAFLGEGEASHWDIYWEVEDAEASLARVGQLGGSAVRGVDDTPYGRLAVATDPAGARFKLRTSP